MYGHLLVMAVVNIVLPFTLIAIGEQSIDSALASILNATVPLAVIVIAPMFLPDERITLARVAGLAVGFAGVILLVAPDLVNLGDSDPTGELLMIGSSLSYAVGNVYARRNVHGLPPMIPALFQVTFAAAIVIPIALIVDRPFATVTLEPSSSRRSCGWGSSAPGSPTSPISRSCGRGAPPGPRWWPTCCPSSGSCSARRC